MRKIVGKLTGSKIAFFTSVPEFGGSEVILADIIQAASLSGAEVICWTPHTAPIRQILRSRGTQVEFRHWPKINDVKASIPSTVSSTRVAPPALRARLWKAVVPQPFRRLAGFFQEARQFRRELAVVQPDLLIVNSDGSEAASLAGGMWNRQRTATLFNLSVAPFRGSALGSLTDRLMKILTMHASSRVLHVSNAACAEWNRLTFFPKTKTKVIYNGVDAAPVPGTLSRASLGLRDDVFVFCVASRLHAIKGHGYLLDAVRLSPEKFAGTKILLCGTGPLEESLRKDCAAPSLAGIVEVLGFRSDVKDIVRISDCMVLPSVESENFSLSVLEAFMLAKPAISTRVGGMAELVLDGTTGLLVSPKSATQLRDAMLRMAQDPQKARELGLNGRELALRNFTREAMMDKYVDVLAGHLGEQ